MLGAPSSTYASVRWIDSESGTDLCFGLCLIEAGYLQVEQGRTRKGGHGGHSAGGASIAAMRGTPIAAVYGTQLSLQSEGGAGYGTQILAHEDSF